jgi:hypothetical protein
MDRPDVKRRGGDRRPLPLASGVVYGPIRSRRLGVSLGINIVCNSSGDAFAAWIDRLAGIRPHAVQIYSTDYPVPTGEIRRVPPYELRRLAADARQRTGTPVRAYGPG